MLLVGLCFACSTAVFNALWDVHSKHIFGNMVSPVVIAVARTIFMWPSFWFVAWMNETPEALGAWREAILPAFASACLSVVAMYLQLRALQMSDISATVPYMSFQSVFSFAASWVIMGEHPPSVGALGIIGVTLGAFWLNMMQPASSSTVQSIKDKKQENKPAKTLMTFPKWTGIKGHIDKGTVYMVGSALVYAFQSPLDKIGIHHSSVLVYGCVHLALICYLNLAVLVTIESANRHTEHDDAELAKKNISRSGAPSLYRAVLERFAVLDWAGVFLNAMLWIMTYVSFLVAVDITMVAYVVAVKRAGCLFTVFLGWLVFKEHGFLRKLPPILLMVLSVIVIVTSKELPTAVTAQSGLGSESTGDISIFPATSTDVEGVFSDGTAFVESLSSTLANTLASLTTSVPLTDTLDQLETLTEKLQVGYEGGLDENMKARVGDIIVKLGQVYGVKGVLADIAAGKL